MSDDKPVPAQRSEVPRRDDWPLATVSGLQTVRLIALPGPSGVDLAESPDWWRLSATKGEVFTENAPAVLDITADVRRVVGNTFFTVGAVAHIEFTPGAAPSMETDAELDELLEQYGSWASHALWDYCRILMMQIASPFTQRTFEMPSLTPTPTYVTAQIRDDEEAEFARDQEEADDQEDEPN